jgi:two-component system phosphate regulon sensor histidine kinase PhoR
VAQNKAMSIALDIPDDLPPVLGEADELQQVFQNLIDNAIKYGRTGTAVTVTIRLTSDPPPAFPRPALSRSIAGPTRAVSVAVTDRGAGIAREHLPRLTERFYRVSVARSREAGGTGLGLAIVKHILNRHRGVLTIESSEGQGSTFTVHLPEYPRT